MRTHTNDFKTEITKFGREINGRIYHYKHYDLVAENNNNILTESDIQLITDQSDMSTKELIDNELIDRMSVVKHGQLLQSLMKEFDFEAKTEIRVGDIVNPQLGVLVNNSYEYLDYGNFIVYSREYIAENQAWSYVCYDKMLYSMISYEPLSLTYPCSIRDFIQAIADKIGLTFANSSDTFTNYDQLVLAEPFGNQSLTYRDILDKLSQVVAGNILINDDDELEIGYPSETNDAIDENNLRDINVNFADKFGPINKVSISQTDGALEYVAENKQSIEQNGTAEVNIVDNEFTLNSDTNTIASNILTKLGGLYYYINNFSTTGICYYDFLDLFDVSIENESYKCLLLNNEITITQGISEEIFTDKLEISNDDFGYKTSVMNSKEVSFKVNQQEGKIESKVSKDGVISAINQSAEQITIEAGKISLEGYTTINNGFSVDENGNMTANNGTFNGGEIILNDDGTASGSKIKIQRNNGNTKVVIFSQGINYYDNNNQTLILNPTNGLNFLGSDGQNAFYSPSYITLYKNGNKEVDSTNYINVSGGLWNYLDLFTSGYGRARISSGIFDNDDMNYIYIKDNSSNESRLTPTLITTPKITAGNIDCGTCTLSSSGNTQVNFNKTFANAPQVVITPITQTSGVIAPKIRSIGTTNFTATLGGSGFTGIDCCWIAIGS